MADKPIARAIVDQFSCPNPRHLPTFFLLPLLPVKKIVDGLFFVIRLGDFGLETESVDIVAEGSATYLVCGLPVARQGDAMLHGGVILTGSPTESDGGPTFSLPKNLKVGGASPIFNNKVIRDLYYLSTLPNGKKILDGIAANGKEVTIVSGDDNMSHPDDLKGASHGTASSTVIYYNPDKRTIYVQGENGKYVACPPQLNLGHELIHGLRWGNGGATTTTVTEDKAVIGPPYDDSKRKYPPGWPTENGLRNDMKLGKRTGYGHLIDEVNLSPDLRPGECKGTP